MGQRVLQQTNEWHVLHSFVVPISCLEVSIGIGLLIQHLLKEQYPYHHTESDGSEFRQEFRLEYLFPNCIAGKVQVPWIGMNHMAHNYLSNFWCVHISSYDYLCHNRRCEIYQKKILETASLITDCWRTLPTTKTSLYVPMNFFRFKCLFTEQFSWKMVNSAWIKRLNI